MIGARTGPLQSAVRPAPTTTAVLHNETDRERRVDLRSRRGSRVTREVTTLQAGETREVDLPEGSGPATVEVHADTGAAAASVDIGDGPPLFTVRERGVLLALD